MTTTKYFLTDIDEDILKHVESIVTSFIKLKDEVEDDEWNEVLLQTPQLIDIYQDLIQLESTYFQKVGYDN